VCVCVCVCVCMCVRVCARVCVCCEGRCTSSPQFLGQCSHAQGQSASIICLIAMSLSTFVRAVALLQTPIPQTYSLARTHARAHSLVCALHPNHHALRLRSQTPLSHPLFRIDSRSRTYALTCLCPCTLCPLSHPLFRIDSRSRTYVLTCLCPCTLCPLSHPLFRIDSRSRTYALTCLCPCTLCHFIRLWPLTRQRTPSIS
jgi:hypothetical protein